MDWLDYEWLVHFIELNANSSRHMEELEALQAEMRSGLRGP